MVFYLWERTEEESASVDDLSFGGGTTPCRVAAYLNKALHLTAIPLRFIAAGELDR